MVPIQHVQAVKVTTHVHVIKIIKKSMESVMKCKFQSRYLKLKISRREQTTFETTTLTTQKTTTTERTKIAPKKRILVFNSVHWYQKIWDDLLSYNAEATFKTLKPGFRSLQMHCMSHKL